jgi:hypothetical protein
MTVRARQLCHGGRDPPHLGEQLGLPNRRPTIKHLQVVE